MYRLKKSKIRKKTKQKKLGATWPCPFCKGLRA